MKQIVITIGLVLVTINIFAQDGYKELREGLWYKMLYDAPGGEKPITGDYVQTHMYLYVGGEKIYSSREVGKKEPLGVLLQEPQNNTDIQHAIKQMTVGDSMSVLMSVDVMLENGIQQYDWMKPGTGQKAEYIVKLLEMRPMAKRE